jgi:hypothetical protein
VPERIAQFPEPFEGGVFDDGFVEAHGFAALRLNKKSIENEGLGRSGDHFVGLRLNKKLGPEGGFLAIAT